MEFNTDWFKKNLENQFSKFEIKYRFFPEGDFGSLDEVGFENNFKGGVINYWGQGYLNVFLWDYQNEKELINIMVEPENNSEKEAAILKLISLLH